MFRRLFLLAIALGALPAQAQVPGADQVHAVTLDNGMQIIIWPDHDIPNVALYNWVRVGSRNEVPGITGLAHFFEHMMFNGTTTRPPGEFDRVLEANGARNNAFTSNDVTVYQDWFPRSALATVFELEADRLRNLAFDPEVIESERGVVHSERRLRVDDNQSGRLMEQVQATAFVAHPYAIPTIGWPSDILAWTIDDLKTFFATYYAPNNCTLVLVGDVDVQETIALARKYFGAIPANAPPPAVRTEEPPQLGERRVNISAPAQTPLVQVAYHALGAADEKVPALELLSRILTDGDASRLHRHLVEDHKLAISVESFVDAGFDPGLFWLMASLPAGGDTAAVEAALDAQLQMIIEQGVSEQELARARSQELASFWRRMATINGKAEALGAYAVLQGDHQRLFTAPATYEKVTAKDIQQIAAAVLQRNNRTVGTLTPPAAVDSEEQP